MKNLSIIIPCYNEAGSLPKLFEACKKACGNRKDVEFIFVNNGSKDDTQAIMTRYFDSEESAFGRQVDLAVNQGYGHGILQGLAHAEGQILSWTHADMQTDPKDVIHAFDQYKNQLLNQQCLIKGKRMGRHLFDALFTAGMSLIASLLLGVKLWDINAQPKMFHRNFMANLNYAPTDFSLDLYLLYTANKHHLPVLNFPVVFGKREFGEAKGGGTLKGKYKLIKRTFGYIFELRRELKKGNR